MDGAIARLGVRMCALHGVQSTMEEFMPWPAKEPEPATPQQVQAFLKSMVKRKE